MEGTFVVFEGDDGWQWELRNENGDPVAVSPTAFDVPTMATESADEARLLAPGSPTEVHRDVGGERDDE